MFKERKVIIQSVVIFVGIILLTRLFHLQIIDETSRLAADNNSRRKFVEYPYRGLVYDRNGEIIVYNKPVYDIMVVPSEVDMEDTTKFCSLLDIDKQNFIERMSEAKGYSYVKPSVFYSQMSNEEFARIQDRFSEYSGFYVTPKTNRYYPYSGMANALGYIGEVTPGILKRDTTNYYKSGDLIGISGLESRYEDALRGKRGVSYKMINVHGVVKGKYKEGKADTIPEPGLNITTTIDSELQKYGEKLMDGKIGSVVAIEPATGEILSIVSAPSYNPNLLTGREFSKNYSLINSDTTKPLYNRPIQADQYPPGSIFKMIQALIALEEGVITPQTRVVCNRSIINCHGPHSYEDLRGAIKHSCNPYFYETFKRIIQQGEVNSFNADAAVGLEGWIKHLKTFGLGQRLGIDLPNERTGVVPTVSLYNRIYGEGSWNFFTVYSLSIGQGELGVSPLQMANLSAIIANRGFYITPHLVKEIGGSKELVPEKYKKKNYTSVSPDKYGVVVDAMDAVVNSGWSGTGARAHIDDIVVCGKTGTAQNPHGEDHSVFMAFAPKDNPKIAVSVYVENAGQGARAAASIAGLMIEKYLKGEIERKNIEDYALEGDFIY
ncbi:penicillin-binding protein 2 [Mangrovivirga cuniculi]|uniref:Penicillin-binding protein 2 n=1 Tax=Mangrovivirga cuniculi TaxID=2715131 RepID=A0A4D7JJ11_9BACT|nr:penicillin-binding protein 2 [Mangrovivirga cuniculi]QCK13370.1 penicillin-binding protein 2 [Mangrovivirga cuniculi]